MSCLNHRVCVITGGSRGAGRGIALALGNGGFDWSVTKSPLYVDRAVVALACAANVMQKSGRVIAAGNLAEKFGFTGEDGRRVARFCLPPGSGD